MPVVDGGQVQAGVVGVGAVEPAVAGGDAEDVADAVELPEADDELPEDGVEARAEPPAGDDRGARGGVHGDPARGPAAVGDERDGDAEARSKKAWRRETSPGEM